MFNLHSVLARGGLSENALVGSSKEFQGYSKKDIALQKLISKEHVHSAAPQVLLEVRNLTLSVQGSGGYTARSQQASQSGFQHLFWCDKIGWGSLELPKRLSKTLVTIHTRGAVNIVPHLKSLVPQLMLVPLLACHHLYTHVCHI